MFNPNDEGPISPMKKLKILSEKQNVVEQTVAPSLQQIKEEIVERKPAAPAEETNKPEASNIEPLLQESTNQYVIFPINHDDMWTMYKELVGNFWAPTETFQQLDKLALNNDEKQFMKYFSSIFASRESRGLVNDNFAEEFCYVIQITEAKFFYGHQLFVQNLHYEMYNKLFELFVTEEDERNKLYKIVENFDAVSSKREWVNQWKHASFGDQLLASACLHGLFFTSLDLVHMWLKNKTRSIFSHEIVDIMEKMIIDQGLQRDFSCLMISHLKAKPSKEKMLETINQTAKLEFDFLLNGLKTLELIAIEPEEIISLIDRNTKILKQKLFNSFDEHKKVTTDADRSETKAADAEANSENSNSSSKENHQKLVFDEDF